MQRSSKFLLAALVAATVSQGANAQNVLLNPGFEERCTVANGWNAFGNVQSADFFTVTGTRCVKMFGPFCCPLGLGFSGVFQDVPAQAGQTWVASGFATSPSWDALSWNNNGTPADPTDDRGTRVFMKIEFYDAGGAIIGTPDDYLSPKLDHQTDSLPVLLSVPPTVAPAGTAFARVVAIAEQGRNVGGAAWFDDLDMRQEGAADNALVNASFEDQVANCYGSPFVGWNNFGNGQANADQSPRTGTYAAKLFGGYNGDPAYSGWWQNYPAVEGTRWKARGWAVTRADDLSQDGNETFLGIEFWDSFGVNLIGTVGRQNNFPAGIANSPGNLTYQQFETDVVEAPAGTAFVRCLVLQIQHGYVGGATWWDDMELFQDNGTPCYADFNQDGGVDGADVEAFYTVWEAGDNAADVNGDGGVDGADVETFFIQWEAGGCG